MADADAPPAPEEGAAIMSDARSVLDALSAGDLSVIDAATELRRQGGPGGADLLAQQVDLIDRYTAAGALSHETALRLRGALVDMSCEDNRTRLRFGAEPSGEKLDAKTQYRGGPIAHDDAVVSATLDRPGAAPTALRPAGAGDKVSADARTALRDPHGGTEHVEQHELREGSIVHDWYRLETLLGFGSMGQVWKATDLQLERTGTPNPYVALKLLSREFAQHELAMAAMSREADKAKKLAHPNNAAVYVFAVDPAGGQGYLAMELLEGTPLDRLLRQHSNGLDRTTAMDIVRGLARGLAYAHSKGIVHCDFKPGNAFVTDSGVAKVLDYGIARLANKVARAGDAFDAGALYAVTPAYASLEMLEEEQPEPDPADDVYALGLVAYELLSGRHPFGGRTAIEVREQGLTPKPLKGVSRREWRAIDRALRLRRAQRWPNAEAFLKSLEGVSRWIPALGGLTVVLAVVAGYVAYQNYLEAMPKVPFEQLPASRQADFRAAMQQGDYAYRFGTSELTGAEAAAAIYRDALAMYAAAYALHEKNRDADAALKRSISMLEQQLEQADPVLKWEARCALQGYRKQYKELAKYAPLERLIDRIGASIASDPRSNATIPTGAECDP
ncbi:MAG TPA: serine/threonine-protein kinase [Steroidobacteraceae bacterium]|nr:serine/threonine-protein kinase [Steroidobacteraceae bacterium]